MRNKKVGAESNEPFCNKFFIDKGLFLLKYLTVAIIKPFWVFSMPQI